MNHWKHTDRRSILPSHSRCGTSGSTGPTHGLGSTSTCNWPRDLGAEPLFLASTAGLAHREVVPHGPDGAVQDALDAIEYANGANDSPWSSLRAKNGPP